MQVAHVVEGLPDVELVLQDAEEFALDVVVGGEQGGTHRIYLDNLFAATRDLEPSERRAAIDRFCSEMLRPRAARGSWPVDRERLRPVLRARMTFSGMPVVRQSALPHLVEAVVIDSPASIAYATADDLKSWGIERDLAFETARANLSATLSEDDLTEVDPGAPRPIVHVTAEDDYEPSRLLLQGWLAALSTWFEGPPVAAIPHRSALLVCGSHPDDIARLQQIADAEYDASPGPLSPALYTVDPEGVVVPLRLAEGHPVHGAVRSAHARLEWDEEWNR